MASKFEISAQGAYNSRKYGICLSVTRRRSCFVLFTIYFASYLKHISGAAVSGQFLWIIPAKTVAILYLTESKSIRLLKLVHSSIEAQL